MRLRRSGRLPHDGGLENGESGVDRVKPARGGLQAGSRTKNEENDRGRD